MISYPAFGAGPSGPQSRAWERCGRLGRSPRSSLRCRLGNGAHVLLRIAGAGIYLARLGHTGYAQDRPNPSGAGSRSSSIALEPVARRLFPREIEGQAALLDVAARVLEDVIGVVPEPTRSRLLTRRCCKGRDQPVSPSLSVHRYLVRSAVDIGGISELPAPIWRALGQNAQSSTELRDLRGVNGRVR